MNEKVIKTIKNVLSWVVIISAIPLAIFTVISVLSSGSGSGGVFGYKFFVSLSDSMSKTHFDAGDVVISQSVDPETLGEGDVISFVTQKDGKDVIVTHMIRKKIVTDTGEKAFITYGTTTGTDDELPVPYGNVLGEYRGKIPWFGHVVQFLKSRVGYSLLILLPLLIMAVAWGINIVKLYKGYKKECRQELEQREAELREERERKVEIMNEIDSIRALLSQIEQDYDDKKGT